jgi:hypothetical protein
MAWARSKDKSWRAMTTFSSLCTEPPIPTFSSPCFLLILRHLCCRSNCRRRASLLLVLPLKSILYNQTVPMSTTRREASLDPFCNDSACERQSRVRGASKGRTLDSRVSLHGNTCGRTQRKERHDSTRSADKDDSNPSERRAPEMKMITPLLSYHFPRTITSLVSMLAEGT